MDIEAITRVALRAADRGGEVLRRHFGRIRRVDKKGVNDLVTEADLAAEAAIVRTLRAAFPDHGILAEESGRHEGRNGAVWIVDPLDGTTNFAHGLPFCAVSIALADAGRPVHGVVLNPFGGELFSAVAGRGATLNGRPIRVSTTARLPDALLATGFPYDPPEAMHARVMGRLAAAVAAARGVRRFGAAALDLCYVACGRLDGFWEEGLKPWDTAAGVLLVREAGGYVTDLDGGEFTLEGPTVLATNGALHRRTAETLTAVGPPAQGKDACTRKG